MVLLENDYKNKTAGVLHSDILELRDLIKDTKGDDIWYKAEIALVIVSVATKTTFVIQQIAGAVKSTALIILALMQE